MKLQKRYEELKSTFVKSFFEKLKISNWLKFIKPRKILKVMLIKRASFIKLEKKLLYIISNSKT
jgi:hypothetical protein